jgi:hypothetical protein
VAGPQKLFNTMKYILWPLAPIWGHMFNMAGASLFLPFLPFATKADIIHEFVD